jgi:phosphoglucosamine mutase
MPKMFGTDGVRGLANRDLTARLALDLGDAAVRVLGDAGTQDDQPEGRRRALVGRDTRVSGDFLASALSAGMAAGGFDVIDAGIIPTPGIAFLTSVLNVEMGAVISASHNPMPDNGIKFFARGGFKLPDQKEDDIEAVLGQDWDRPTGAGVGHIIKMKDARKAYVDHAIDTLDGLRLDGLVVAVDCGHGASCQTTPVALQRLGATVHAINTDYCGTDINVECGSTHLEPLRELVLRTHADIGLAHDGDADRVLFVDSEGNEIDGDYILAICGSDLAARGKLANSEIVSTVMCNLGFSIAMKEQGFEMVQTAVGDRYVLERMLADGAVIGGEQSGHIIFLEHNTTGDGLVTALQLLAVLKRTGRTLTDLAGIMKKYPQVLVNVHSDNKAGLDDCQPIWDAVAAAEKELDGRGRILVRPSGTEPLVRVMAEAETHELTQRVVDDIVEVVKRELP